MRLRIIAAALALSPAAVGAAAMDVRMQVGSLADPASDCPARFAAHVDGPTPAIRAFDGRACAARFAFKGPFTADSAAFAAALANYVPAFGAVIVALDSSGGDVEAAIENGKAIRKHGASTVVPPGASCASACVYAFIGGVER